MSKPKIFFGVDLGSTYIKVVELKESKGGIALAKAGFINISSDKTLNPFQKRQLQAKKLAKLLASMQIKNASAVISVPGQSVLIRLIKLPPVPETKLEQVIKYEAQQQVPFSLDEVVWDYALLKRKKVLEIEILLVAIKVDLIKEVQKKLPPHLNTAIIDVSPLAFYNCVRYNRDYLDEEKGAAIINIGSESTDMVIFKREVLWTRSFPIGGNNFSQALQKEFGLSYNEAERIKKGGLKDYPQEEINRVIKPIIADLIVEIQHAIGYYRNQEEGLTIGEIILAGGSSKLPNLTESFAKSLGLEVRNVNPFKRIKCPGEAKILAENKWEAIEPYQHLFPVAIGLALREKAKCTVEINLLSQELLKKKGRHKKKESAVFLAGALLVILAGGTLLFQQASGRSQKQLEEVQKIYKDEYEIYRPQIAALKKDLLLLQSNAQAMHFLLDKKMLPLELLRAVGKSLAPAIWLDNFSFPEKSQRAEGKGVKFLFIKGKGASYGEINKFMQNLKTSTACIKEVEALVSNPVTVEGKEFIEFSLEAELVLSKVESRK